ncbi:MAG: L,D-transpeptidase [Casimicrobiaceae bacterium]
MLSKQHRAITLTFALALSAILSLPATAAKKNVTRAHAPSGAQLSIDAVNNAALGDATERRTSSASVLLRAQILLDRAHFSPGEIDAASGSNQKRALLAYQKQKQLPATGTLDGETWKSLTEDSAPALIEYTIKAEDVAGPFKAIPAKMEDKVALPALGYSSPAEALGERFHVSPKLLKRLNPRQDFGREGETIVVPNVEESTALQKAAKGSRVVVSRSASTVTLLDPAGNVVAHFPATTGSEHDPLPSGNWKINGVAHNPKFHYNPKLFWDAQADSKKATIPPGPNNPVGVVWIDLSKEHYGIHGTPEPSTIGKTQSHGCIRLTNWDAAALAKAVSPGMPAVLEQ